MTVSKQNSEIITTTNKKKTGHTYVQWLIAVLAAMNLLNYGFVNGWASPMKKVLQSPDSPSGRPLTDNEISWIVSIIPLTACVGTFLYSYIADTYGRKVGIIAMMFPQAFCWIIKLFFTHPLAIIAARVFAGIPIGGSFNLIPMYIKEISQDNNRGTLVACTMTFVNIGILSIYAMGAYLDYYVVIWIVVSISVTAAFLVFLLPESPAFLVKKEKLEDAAKTIAKLRGLDIDDQIIKKEMDYMKNQEEYFRNVKRITFVNIFRNKAWVRGFCFLIFLYSSTNFNGTLSITAYAWTIMTNAGVTVNPELQTLSIPAVMTFGSLVSMTFVEKFGRKPILVSAFALAAASHACLATTLYLQAQGDDTIPFWVPVLAIVGATWAHAGGVVPMVYVILAEIFNFQIRARLIGLVITYAWFVGFAQMLSFQLISDAFGMYTTFYMYATINFVGAIVCIVFQPETKGKTVEEIEKLILGKKQNKLDVEN